MKIQYYGHSCFAVEIGAKRILFDPFIAGNPLAKDIDIQTVKADYILISHGHGDHIGDVEVIAKNNNAPVIGAYEVVSWLESRGLIVYHMNIGGKRKFNFGTVKMVNAVHSSMLPDGSYGANPSGFLVYGDDYSFYFAGDTALTMDMQLIPLWCPNLDFAILPVGDNFTMGYEDALIASDFIKCNTIIGCHYDSFPIIEINHRTVETAFEDRNKKIYLPAINSVVVI
ncbi:MAG: metal-dependent hydrolase [Saprospiraceae bacterium]|nr:metal-dependent hydrolase [Saprospiraceae bacterium]MBK8449723.1 metal-dependent hydrolase [Saprospiraceae bacterium]MBK8484207.1 metal-dependent hydrolase [Saprospiraceae bacterium]MBK9221609.1 metal-dependent hydrolase [Saprospiraceae bacterium]MBK9721452.1 metal-dependent hydrolase [Saprospiraceae bacterium]